MFRVTFNFPYSSITLDNVGDAKVNYYRELMQYTGVFPAEQVIKVGDHEDVTLYQINPTMVTYVEYKELKADPWS